MTDGWHAASTLLAWTLGALPALFLLAIVIGAVILGAGALIEWISHNREVRRIRRQTRRSGRA